jgi:hypothetical protein
MATATAEVAKKGRTKKGEGPYTLSFVDGENKDSARIPANVASLKVADKAGKSKTYALSGLSPAIIHQLAADGMKRRLDASMRNNIGGDKTAIVLADEAYANIKAGKLYSKGEGKGGAGRTFDFDLWVMAIERTAKLKNANDPKKHKAATKAQLEALRTKLTAATPKDRAEMTAKWKKDPTFVLAKKQVDAERAGKQEIKDTDTDALADLF